MQTAQTRQGRETPDLLVVASGKLHVAKGGVVVYLALGVGVHQAWPQQCPRHIHVHHSLHGRAPVHRRYQTWTENNNNTSPPARSDLNRKQQQQSIGEIRPEQKTTKPVHRQDRTWTENNNTSPSARSDLNKKRTSPLAWSVLKRKKYRSHGVMNEWKFIYSAYKNFHTKPCVITAPDTQYIHVSSLKLKTTKGHSYQKVQTARTHPPLPKSWTIHSS